MTSFASYLSLALIAHGLLGLEVVPQLDEPDHQQVRVTDPVSGSSLLISCYPRVGNAPDTYTFTRGNVQTRYEILENLVIVVGGILLLDRATEENKLPSPLASPLMLRARSYLRAMGVSGVAVENALDLVGGQGDDVVESAVAFRDLLLGTVTHVTKGWSPPDRIRPHAPRTIQYMVLRPEPSGPGRYPVGDSLGFALAMAIRSVLDHRATTLDEVYDKKTIDPD